MSKQIWEYFKEFGPEVSTAELVEHTGKTLNAVHSAARGLIKGRHLVRKRITKGNRMHYRYTAVGNGPGKSVGPEKPKPSDVEYPYAVAQAKWCRGLR